MFSLKNYSIIIMLFFSLALPLGGIGISGLSNFISYDSNESLTDDVSSFNLSFQNNGSEQGFNFFLYFDALPFDLAIEYSREFKYQELSSTIVFNLDSANETFVLDNPTYAGRISDYFTIRKDMMDLSIPVLAKVALSVGGGFNKHQSILPSIALLKDIYNVDDLTNLYDASEQDWDSNAIYEALADNTIDGSGIHLQCGVQAKVLMINAFINAKYTFIISDDSNNLDSFPGLTFGLAYGL